MSAFDRRKFLQAAGLSSIPLLISGANTFGNTSGYATPVDGTPDVKLFGDGEMFDIASYIEELKKINTAKAIEPDRYAAGGVVAALEKKFENITGKDKAVYMPSGTMANQLAISVLSGDNAKVFVQETSHVFRDEADAAQTVFGKRLIPLAKGEAYFTAAQLQQAIDYHKAEEVFKSGFGCVSVENPVRRSDGRMIPLEEIKKISRVCADNNIRTHLDGARIYMASAWSGVTVKEYASYFDTIYISLYKYLGASSGAILCGSGEVIGKMEHLIKVHGGSMYRNWTSAAMALQRLDGMEARLQSAIARSKEIFAVLNRNPVITITALKDGTNIYLLTLANNINGNKLAETLNKKHGIKMGRPDNGNIIRISVNETLMYKDVAVIIRSFEDALASSKA
jgi:threonine aldolase